MIVPQERRMLPCAYAPHMRVWRAPVLRHRDRCARRIRRTIRGLRLPADCEMRRARRHRPHKRSRPELSLPSVACVLRPLVCEALMDVQRDGVSLSIAARSSYICSLWPVKFANLPSKTLGGVCRAEMASGDECWAALAGLSEAAIATDRPVIPYLSGKRPARRVFARARR